MKGRERPEINAMQNTSRIPIRFRTRTSIHRLLVAALCASCIASAATAEPAPVERTNATDGVALKGYDPVAYFTVGQPTAGVANYTQRWKGATYRFVSAENRARFMADPEKYLPQYGGYCAYAMALNRIADIDPARWAIVDGKLYLNNNFLSQTLWSVNKGSNIASADGNWKVLPKRPPVE